MEAKESLNPPKESEKKRVLLVDDDAEVLEATRLALTAHGYDVTVARDGSQGLALAERNPPDLLILDMMMPKRSGFLVLETLRQFERKPTRIIMVTANEGNRHREYAQQLGVDEYIRKPFSMDTLLDAVARVMKK
ncbi:MAG: response regulator [Planctomycetaceae bacterium]|jgi:DNA-binding response OmpR family regulator|nr:response regulator [Planctomycetaceae bacterium]